MIGAGPNDGGGFDGDALGRDGGGLTTALGGSVVQAPTRSATATSGTSLRTLIRSVSIIAVP